VFVLDVNQDYRPWLIDRAKLYSAMDTFDREKKRGLLRVERAGLGASSRPAGSVVRPDVLEEM
jgi:hypothetical protein